MMRPVQNECLLRFGKAQFPRRAGVLDRAPGRGTRAAVMAGNGQVIGLGLGDTCGDRAHAVFGYQLDADRGAMIGVFQVMDELRQVFDRVDVVVRRRADELHAGRGVAQAADVLGNFFPRQLAALARFGALRHLDLDLFGRGEVFGGDAKTTRGDLLDLGLERIAFF